MHLVFMGYLQGYLCKVCTEVLKYISIWCLQGTFRIATGVLYITYEGNNSAITVYAQGTYRLPTGGIYSVLTGYI